MLHCAVLCNAAMLDLIVVYLVPIYLATSIATKLFKILFTLVVPCSLLIQVYMIK